MRSLTFLHQIAQLLLAAVIITAPARSDDMDPRRPAAIATENVPVVPDELFARLSQYQNVRTATFSDWAPDGRGMLIATRFGNSTQLHRVYEPGGRREQVTFFDEPVAGRFVPDTSSGDLLISMSQGGNENFQIYFLNAADGQATLLTDGTSRNSLGPVDRQGERMIVQSNRRNGRDTDIYMADCRKPGGFDSLMETDAEFWVPTDWSEDSTRLFLLRYVSINESYPALLDVATKKRQDLPLPGKGQMSFGSGAFTRDGKSAYITCDARGEFLELAKLDLSSGAYEWLNTGVQWDVESIEVDPTSGTLAFTVNEDGASRLYLWQDGRARLVELPLGVVANLKFSPDGKTLGFTLARPDAPADAYSVNVADGSLTRWTYSEVGGLNPSRFITPSRIQFKSFDGREIPAYYYQPRTASAEKPAPVVIQIHGGPESQYRPIFSGVTQFYANELGYAVIAPNVRGSSGYGKTYLKLDNGPLRENSVKDIGALLDWIARQPELDKSRVAVVGGSYGGYMVLASLVHFGDRLRAGVDIVGIASFTTFLKNTSSYRQDLRRAEYGDERDPQMLAVFERINPLANALKIRSELLVAHGVNDPRVPFSEAQQIVKIVRDGGRNVWTVYAENEGHGFAKKDNRDYLTAVEAMFLKESFQ